MNKFNEIRKKIYLICSLLSIYKKMYIYVLFAEIEYTRNYAWFSTNVSHP